MAMPAESTSDLMTSEDLLRAGVPGKSTELVRGHLVVREPPGTRHGSVAGRLNYLLADHVYRHDLGVVCGQDTGFEIESNPDTVRAPDAAVVSRPRVSQIPPRGYAPFAPDLAAEIVSPDDRPGEVLAEVGEWLRAGTRVVWGTDPSRNQAHVYRDDGDLTIVPLDGALDGAPVLPGFTCPLAEILR